MSVREIPVRWVGTFVALLLYCERLGLCKMAHSHSGSGDPGDLASHLRESSSIVGFFRL